MNCLRLAIFRRPFSAETKIMDTRHTATFSITFSSWYFSFLTGFYFADLWIKKFWPRRWTSSVQRSKFRATASKLSKRNKAEIWWNSSGNKCVWNADPTTHASDNMTHFPIKMFSLLWQLALRTKVCLPKVENLSTCLRTKDSLP